MSSSDHPRLPQILEPGFTLSSFVTAWDFLRGERGGNCLRSFGDLTILSRRSFERGLRLGDILEVFSDDSDGSSLFLLRLLLWFLLPSSIENHDPNSQGILPRIVFKESVAEGPLDVLYFDCTHSLRFHIVIEFFEGMIQQLVIDQLGNVNALLDDFDTDENPANKSLRAVLRVFGGEECYTQFVVACLSHLWVKKPSHVRDFWYEAEHLVELHRRHLAERERANSRCDEDEEDEEAECEGESSPEKVFVMPFRVVMVDFIGQYVSGDLVHDQMWEDGCRALKKLSIEYEACSLVFGRELHRRFRSPDRRSSLMLEARVGSRSWVLAPMNRPTFYCQCWESSVCSRVVIRKLRQGRYYAVLEKRNLVPHRASSDALPAVIPFEGDHRVFQFETHQKLVVQFTGDEEDAAMRT